MKKTLILLVILVISLEINAQIITTVAGNSSTTSTGDGGLAVAAGIGEPDECAFDSHNNLYFVDVENNVVRKVTPCGIITTVAGNGISGYNGDGILATDAELNGPSGIAFDSHDNMYIAELYGIRVRKINVVTNIITTIAGNGMAIYSGDGGPATAATFNYLNNICFDKKQNLYVTDGSNRIRKIDTFGIITTIAGDGIAGYTGDGGLATSAKIENLYGICSDTVGNIFFVQMVDNRVRKIDTLGIITTIAGNGSYITSGDGGLAIDAGLDVSGLAIDKFNNIYVAGYIDNNVRKINDSGLIYTVAGNGISGYSGDGGLADSAELSNANGVNCDIFGNIFIADKNNSRIRKVTFNPVINPTVSIIANTADTICTGIAVTYTATVSGAVTSLAYQWIINGAPVSAATGSSYTYTPADNDSIRCVLSVTGLCNTVSSTTITMVVDTITTPTISVTAPATALAGNTATLTGTVAGAGSSYTIKWYDNGVLIGTTATPSLTYTVSSGPDTITATIFPSAPCADTAVSIPQVIIVNHDAVQAISAARLSIYPNPARDEITITGNDLTRIGITNTIGQPLLSWSGSSEKERINISMLPTGIYLIKVTDNNGHETISKFLKQ